MENSTSQTSKNPPPLLILTGESGSGKSTLINFLKKTFPERFTFSVSHTSRKPRINETNGREYYFVTYEDMQKMIENNELIEYTQFSGNIYGTSKKTIADNMKENRICILDLDMNGVQAIKKCNFPAFFLSIKPLREEELVKRLVLRKTDSEEAIQKRIMASKEFEKFINENNIFDAQIENTNLEEAEKSLVRFMQYKYPEFDWKPTEI